MATPSLTLPDLDSMSAEDVIRWASGEFGERLCLTCSWQKQSSVLVHMVSELGLGIDVIELDTHLFFRESYETRDRLVERYGLNLLRPEIATIAEQHRDEGPNLWERDPDRCCHIRKVEPLLKALAPYGAPAGSIRTPVARRDAEARMVGDLRRLEGAPAGRLGREARLGLHHDQRDSVQPAARRRLPVDRLHSLHPAGRTRRGGARRPLGRLGQARMWHTPGKDVMTEHIYAHEHPESEHRRDGGFTLWFTGLSGAGKTTSSGPSSTAAGSSSSTWTATPVARTCRRASASRRRTATRTSSASAGSPLGSRARAAP